MALRIIVALVLLAALAECRDSFFKAIEESQQDPLKARCKGAWHNCCTKQKPCNLGDGDCDRNSDCRGGLVCGTNNCPKFGKYKDCCTQRCKGAWHHCCTPRKPCGLRDGDCDQHIDCSGNLVCGVDNCPKRFGKGKDCCVRPKKPRCKGKWHHCCTSKKKCGMGDGDCDKDSDCIGSLVCGTDNCPKRWGKTKDCCTKKGFRNVRLPLKNQVNDEAEDEPRVDVDEDKD